MRAVFLIGVRLSEFEKRIYLFSFLKNKKQLRKMHSCFFIKISYIRISRNQSKILTLITPVTLEISSLIPVGTLPETSRIV